MPHQPVTIWAIADGRPGHWNQVLGLVEALARRVVVHDVAITAPSRLQSATDLLARRWRATDSLPDPDLIIGAGHATHVPMLIARTSRGGNAIVLMRPTFPVSMFDLCFIPESQVRGEHPAVVPTRGAINRMRPAVERDSDSGMVLVGGPSRHVRWDDQHVLDQIFEVCSRRGDMHWTITTSRRTPEGLLRGLHQLGLLNVTLVDGRSTDSNWLPTQLARTTETWATIDSVSMVFESLTAGCAVGLLDVPLRKKNGKLARNLQNLIARGDVTAIDTWRATGTVNSPSEPLLEADRCADEIIRRFLADVRQEPMPAAA